VYRILLFVAFYRTEADTDVVEDAKIVTMVGETDDSCITRPLDRVVNDYCTPDCTGPIIEVKWDNFPDVKIEIANENDVECPDISVKVSMCCLPFYHVYTCSLHNLAIKSCYRNAFRVARCFTPLTAKRDGFFMHSFIHSLI